MLLKNSGMSSSSTADVGRTTKEDNEFASFEDAAVAAIIVNASSSSASVAETSELSEAEAAAATTMEKNAITSNSNDKED